MRASSSVQDIPKLSCGAKSAAISGFCSDKLEPIAYSVAVPVHTGDARLLEEDDTRTPMQGPRQESGESGVAVEALSILTPSLVEGTTVGAHSALAPKGVVRNASLVSSFFR